MIETILFIRPEQFFIYPISFVGCAAISPSSRPVTPSAGCANCAGAMLDINTCIAIIKRKSPQALTAV